LFTAGPLRELPASELSTALDMVTAMVRRGL
jgi:hypothetical protein